MKLACQEGLAVGGSLEEKLDGLAVRVPLLNASLTDCVFEVQRPTTVEEVNRLLQAAAEGPLAGILGYEERPLVSVDFKDDPRSAVIDAPSTMVVDGTQVKVLAWYDNEWGYVNRMAELARLVALSLTGTGSRHAAAVGRLERLGGIHGRSVERAGGRDGLARGHQVLLGPHHDVALRTGLEQRIAHWRRHDRCGAGRRDRRPAGRGRRLP